MSDTDHVDLPQYITCGGACKQTKHRSLFYDHPRMATGKQHQCIDCAKAYTKKLRELHKQRRERKARAEREAAQNLTTAIDAKFGLI